MVDVARRTGLRPAPLGIVGLGAVEIEEEQREVAISSATRAKAIKVQNLVCTSQDSRLLHCPSVEVVLVLPFPSARSAFENHPARLAPAFLVVLHRVEVDSHGSVGVIAPSPRRRAQVGRVGVNGGGREEEEGEEGAEAG